MPDLKHLPRWASHTLLLVLMAVVGYGASEIKRSRETKEAMVERVVVHEVPELRADVAVLQIKVAALNGSQERIERKVDNVQDKLEAIARSQARLEALIRNVR